MVTILRRLSRDVGFISDLTAQRVLFNLGDHGADAVRRSHVRGRPVGGFGGRDAQRQLNQPSATFAPMGEVREGGVLPRGRPSTPSAMTGNCQRHTQVFDLLVRRMISCVPAPSAARSTTLAGYVCLCGAWPACRTPPAGCGWKA